jgi:hypothetical protein
MRRLETELKARKFKPAYVHDSAATACDLGFSILRNHDFESTAWMIANAIQLEALASLKADVILIDRPVPDALGYLIAALGVTGRKLAVGKLERLEALCAAWVDEYDLILVTELDRSVPIGPGRDDDEPFRVAAAEAISDVLTRLAPGRVVVSAREADKAYRLAIDEAEKHRASW